MVRLIAFDFVPGGYVHTNLELTDVHHGGIRMTGLATSQGPSHLLGQRRDLTHRTLGSAVQLSSGRHIMGRSRNKVAVA